MIEIVWSPQAIEDVESTREYISRDSPNFGSLVAERIIDAVERLRSFPESGRIVPEFGNQRLARCFGGTIALFIVRHRRPSRL